MSLVSLAYFDSPFFVSLSAEWFASFFFAFVISPLMCFDTPEPLLQVAAWLPSVECTFVSTVANNPSFSAALPSIDKLKARLEANWSRDGRVRRVGLVDS